MPGLELPAEQAATVGVGTMIDAGEDVRWLHAPDLDGKLQTFEYPDHLIVVPNMPGVFYVGADTPASPAVWCKIVVAEPKSSWRLPAMPSLPWGKIAYWLAILVFAVAVFFAGRHLPGPSPVDPPAPTPPGPVDPPKPPTPKEAPLWVVVVEESAKRTPQQAAMLASPALAARLKAKGHHFRIVDKDAKAPDGSQADYAAFVQRAAGKDLPQLFLVTTDGDVRFEGRLPEPEAALIDTLGKAGG